MTVDGEAIELPPESYEPLETGDGEFEIVVTTDGRELTRETVVIPDGRDIALYNVLGAAWVFGETVWYTRYGGPEGDRNWELYAFEAFHDIDEERVHYEFRQPPDSVSTSSESSRVYYRVVGVAEGSQWNWRYTLSEARRQNLASYEPATRCPTRTSAGPLAGVHQQRRVSFLQALHQPRRMVRRSLEQVGRAVVELNAHGAVL